MQAKQSGAHMARILQYAKQSVLRSFEKPGFEQARYLVNKIDAGDIRERARRMSVEGKEIADINHAKQIIGELSHDVAEEIKLRFHN